MTRTLLCNTKATFAIFSMESINNKSYWQFMRLKFWIEAVNHKIQVSLASRVNNLSSENKNQVGNFSFFFESWRLKGIQSDLWKTIINRLNPKSFQDICNSIVEQKYARTNAWKIRKRRNCLEILQTELIYFESQHQMQVIMARLY